MENLNGVKTNAATIAQKSFVFLKSNWMSIVAVILLGVLGYYMYNHFFVNSSLYNVNRENLENNENSNKTANLMLFFVDWCPHCKTAKPEWENLKTQYEGKNINGYTVVFTEYNCTTESAETEELMNKYSIEGYPTVKLLKDNQIIEYDAKPTKSTMEQFLHTVL
jgi:thiol-disulfide isomerase/thioredoxin